MNYFSESSMLAKINKFHSSKRTLKLGEPQGSILGPFFLIIFINDLALSSLLPSFLFADDTTIFYSNKNTIQELISGFQNKFCNIHEWVSHNKLYINWSKTKFILLTKSKSKNNSILRPNYIKLSGNKVEVVTEFKLLGLMIDVKLSFEADINLLRIKVNQKLFAIF